jgi:6-phosphogluconolactonase (cycloisomerase 2 family)
MTGPTTLIGFVCGVTFDKAAREIFAVNNDIEDTMMVFSYEDNGNPKPKRVLSVPHGAWGISMSKARNEFSLSIQDGSNNAVVTYARDAKGFDAPLRVLQGRETELADPHGIFVDDNNKELIVANWGSWNLPLGRYTSTTRQQIDFPGGKFFDPSITVYDATAEGNTKPLRKIQGPNTELNWPTGIDVDLVNNEIVVANNIDNSVLFFRRGDSGNVKPVRVIKGSRTGIVRPMGVAVDQKNKELWVANFGDHTAVVFDLRASGNAAPKRIIRNAPRGTPTVGFGHPMTLSYDSKRGEILVPN